MQGAVLIWVKGRRIRRGVSTGRCRGPRMSLSLEMYRYFSMLPECQLFGTLGCHLCEVAEAVLIPFVEHGLLVELVDIAEDETWFARYQLKIPVLRRSDTGAELDWPFDADQVAAFLG